VREGWGGGEGWWGRYEPTYRVVGCCVLRYTFVPGA
jgi:hypothetical protein